jgi:thiamine biosynthesis lipoprotein
MKFLIFICFILLFACSPTEHPTSFQGVAMTIEYKILIGKQNLTLEDQNRIEGIIASTFGEVHAIYNKWNPNSELSKLNQIAAHTTVELSPKLAHLLQLTDEVVTLSNGLFDPTIEPIQRLWKTKLQVGAIPTQQEINSLAPAIGWSKIHFTSETFSKDHQGVSLDLGGIAKGYAVDLLVQNLNEAGFPDLLVEWGGEMRATGNHPSGRPWKIFISAFGDPTPEKALGYVELHNQAIATSGNYLQFWIVEENHESVTYFHIINPKNLRPLKIGPKSIGSASVLAETCSLADGLATVAMMFSDKQEAQNWASEIRIKYPDLKFWFESGE